ncbi:hypothetical protein ACOMHN_046928 [Nucella lapillus]
MTSARPRLTGIKRSAPRGMRRYQRQFNGTGNKGVRRYQRQFNGTGNKGVRRYQRQFNGTGDKGVRRYQRQFNGTGDKGMRRYQRQFNGTGNKGVRRHQRQFNGSGNKGVRRYQLQFNGTGNKGVMRYQRQFNGTGNKGMRRYQRQFKGTGNKGMRRYQRQFNGTGNKGVRRYQRQFNGTGNKGVKPAIGAILDRIEAAFRFIVRGPTRFTVATGRCGFTGVLDILKKVIVNRTCVIATSLIREITYADVIAVMSHGHVIEEGTHRELVALKGCYYTLLLQQERDTHHLPSKLRKKEQKQMKRIHDRLVMADSICKHQMDNLRPYAANKSTKIRFDS